MKFHALSEIFPLLEGQAFEELVADIRENGVREPVWIYQDQILDGRNRFRAAEAAGREAPTREYTGDDPVKFVISLNLHRRHLDESQRAMVATKLAALTRGRPAENGPRDTVTQENAAELMNVGVRSVKRARKVMEKAAPEVVQAVERGELKVNVAAEIATASKEEQVAAIGQGKSGVRELRKKIKGSAAPTKSKKQLAEEKLDKAYEHLLAFRDAIGNKDLTPAALVDRNPWLCLPKTTLTDFIAKAAKLADVKRKKIDQKIRADRRKLRAMRSKELAKRKAKRKAAQSLTRKSARRVQKQIDTRIRHERRAAKARKPIAPTRASRRPAAHAGA